MPLQKDKAKPKKKKITVESNHVISLLINTDCSAQEMHIGFLSRGGKTLRREKASEVLAAESTTGAEVQSLVCSISLKAEFKEVSKRRNT